MRLLLLALALLAAPACAQSGASTAEADASEAGDAPVRDTAWTETEEAVHAALQEDGIHVVHFWAPWCDNSTIELRNDWYALIEANPEVAFTFVTVWSDGALARDVLERYGIPERVTVLAQPDYGRSADRENRRRSFMGLPMTWTPSTWVFRDNGVLAYAFNYGELQMTQVQTAIDDARNEWEHE